jgi:hypothetical protein
MAFSTFTLTKLGTGAIGTSAATLYTVPVSTRTMVKSIDIANTSGSAMTVTVYLVPSGGSVGAGNMLLPDVTVLDAGDFISTVASATGSTIHVSGAEAV